MRLWIVLAAVAAFVMTVGAATWMVWSGQGPADPPVSLQSRSGAGSWRGLMALALVSSRRGYDERADRGIR